MAKITRYNRSVKRFKRTKHNWRNSNRQNPPQILNKSNATTINDLSVKRRNHNNPVGKLENNMTDGFSHEKLFVIAKTENNGAIHTLPFDKYKVFDIILRETTYNLWNPKLLMKILTMCETWIGSHVHSLEDYIIETRQGHDENDVPFDWPICTNGSCNTVGIGSCTGWCVGGKCEPDVSFDTQTGKLKQGNNWSYELVLTYNF